VSTCVVKRSFIIVCLGLPANVSALADLPVAPGAPATNSAAPALAAIDAGTNGNESPFDIRDGYFRRASDEERRGDWQAALTHFTQVIAISPGFAEAWRNRGSVKEDLNDWAGALADFSQTIALDPSNIPACVSRAFVKRHLSDEAGAQADFNHALELKPGTATDYFNHGLAEVNQADPDAALADYTHAIELNPSYPAAYLYRSIVKAEQGDSAGALADADTAIEINPSYIPAYSTRGYLHYNRHEFAEALADFRRFDEADSQISQLYVRLHIWLIRSRLGETGPATAELRTYLQNHQARKPDGWGPKIASFLMGDLPEPDLFKAADNADKKKNDRRLCEAWFYAGSKRLIEGDQSTAVDDFTKCLATNEKKFQEYQGAAAELKSLPGAGQESPPTVSRPRTLNQARASTTPAADIYDQMLYASINNRWNYLVGQRSDLYAKINVFIIAKFNVSQDGSVSNIKLSGSTDSLVAPLCARAIADCSPFPPWPDSLRSGMSQDSHREMSLTFSLNQTQ